MFLNLTGTYLQFRSITQVTQPSLKFKLSDWLKNDKQRLISDMGFFGRVIITMWEVIFQKIYYYKFSFQFYNQYQNHSSGNWNKNTIFRFLILSILSHKKIFPIHPNPELCWIHIEVIHQNLALLLCETTIYFSSACFLYPYVCSLAILLSTCSHNSNNAQCSKKDICEMAS